MKLYHFVCFLSKTLAKYTIARFLGGGYSVSHVLNPSRWTENIVTNRIITQKCFQIIDQAAYAACRCSYGVKPVLF